MDPGMLIDPTSHAGIPAPMWFIQFFKVLGFTLHSVPMNLWYAGILVALLLRTRGGEHGRRFAARLMTQMPVIVAFGVNLGIVPLLFVQVAYFKLFYPATILMAWHWLMIVVLLIPAYYGVYYYAAGLRKKDAEITPGRTAVGWFSALLFLLIGFIFANGFSLMGHVERWPELWQGHQVAGAATGTAWNVGDASLWPRWLLMFGLAVTTTAAWMVVDAALFGRKESDEYQRWTRRAACKLYAAGTLAFALAGSWYVFGTWAPEIRQAMFSGTALPLTLATAVSPGLAWLVFWRASRSAPSGISAALVAVAQVGVLALNAVSRQVVQNLSIARFFDVLGQPTAVEWGPLLLFLVAFVFGVGVVVWMLVQVIGAATKSAV